MSTLSVVPRISLQRLSSPYSQAGRWDHLPMVEARESSRCPIVFQLTMFWQGSQKLTRYVMRFSCATSPSAPVTTRLSPISKSVPGNKLSALSLASMIPKGIFARAESSRICMVQAANTNKILKKCQRTAHRLQVSCSVERILGLGEKYGRRPDYHRPPTCVRPRWTRRQMPAPALWVNCHTK